MTTWQEEHSGGPFGPASGDGAGRPLSRREAREAERRAAETLVEKPPHPSGVVDFEAHDFGPEFTPDQAFDVGDTQDIWQALTRGAQPAGTTGSTPRSGSAVPEAPTGRGGQDGPGMSGDLMDRVRDAVLRRPSEPEAPPQRAAEQAVASVPPVAFDSQAYDRRTLEPRPTTASEPWQRPAARAAEPQAYEPQSYDSQSYDPQTFLPRGGEPAPTRRARRLRETADLREDGLPSELFAQHPVAAPQPVAAPEPALPAAFDEYEDDDYYDEPYAPEPTIAIPVRAAAVEARTGSNPIALPQAFSEPAGDDALTFSSPIAQVPVEHRGHAVDADPEFIEPAEQWEQEQHWAAQPRAAAAPMPFIQPQRQDDRFTEPQIGPPSEMTDLAGFEALIRKARQQPPAPQPVEAPAARGALSWADEDEDQQGGFGTLLGRQVQSSHGTSGALILPNDPQPVDLTQAVSGSGDIFVTGTMKLSRSLSTTGGHDDLYDSPEIDRLYDVAHDEPAAGVAPVRASKAVSGTAQNRSIVSGRPSRGNVLPTVLAIVAGAMAVGVVTLLVGSWLFHIF